MRHLPLGATLCALLALGSADAQARDVYGPMMVSGGLTVTWSGDPGSGCAAAGLCGYSGSVQLSGDDGRNGEFFFSLDGDRLVSSSSSIATDPAVEVRRTEGGVEKGTCSDRVADASLDLFTLKAKRGRARFKPGSFELSSARCAGPSPLFDAIDRLPARTVPLKQVSKGNTTLDLSGSAPYKSGRFSGTVTSTLKFHLGKGRSDVSEPLARRAARRRAKPRFRVVSLRALYRVASYTGKLSASFGGLTGAPCASLDSCGVSGSVDWAVRASGGFVKVEGDARVGRSAHGLRDAIAAIRRRGASVYSFGDIKFAKGTTTADLTRPGGVACHDTARNASRGISVIDGRTPRIVLGGDDAFFTADDIVRAGCPGPRDRDLFGFRPIAKGPLRLRWLALRRFEVPLAGFGQFSGPGYSGSRSVHFKLGLRRVALRVTYRRARSLP